MLRVAPWVLHGNTSPFDRVRSAAFYSAYVADLKIAIGAAGLDFVTYKATSKVNPKHLDYWNDQWTQDLYQTGWTAMPAPGGKMQYMRVANARPWGRAAGDDWLPITWLVNAYLAPDQAVATFYKQAETGSTYDSHGNHDLLPPYENGDDKFPVGRIIHGSNVLPETKAFYNAQQVQGPALVVKTDWLAVGHVDEALSYAPAKTPRGWKLLVSSDDLAVTMFEKAQKDGHGAVTFWSGLSNYDPKTDKQKDAEVSIDATLADVDLMEWSQKAQIQINGNQDAVQKAVGLKDDEIVFIPCLSEDVGGGSSKKPENKIAWMPGTVNSLVYGDYIAMPNPFGPTIDGNDLFAKDLQDRLGTAVNQLGHDGMGMKVHLIDDFSSYHIAMGEVHCGTNPEGPPPAGFMWWAVGR
jgi:protein-arginine deiminase